MVILFIYSFLFSCGIFSNEILGTFSQMWSRICEVWNWFCQHPEWDLLNFVGDVAVGPFVPISHCRYYWVMQFKHPNLKAKSVTIFMRNNAWIL